MSKHKVIPENLVVVRLLQEIRLHKRRVRPTTAGVYRDEFLKVNAH